MSLKDKVKKLIESNYGVPTVMSLMGVINAAANTEEKPVETLLEDFQTGANAGGATIGAGLGALATTYALNNSSLKNILRHGTTPQKIAIGSGMLLTLLGSAEGGRRLSNYIRKSDYHSREDIIKDIVANLKKSKGTLPNNREITNE